MSESFLMLNGAREFQPLSIEPKLMCSICLCMFNEEHFYSVGCGHKFCQNCLRSHIEEQFQRYQLIVCAQQGCGHVIDHSKNSIYHVLESREQTLIDTILSNFARMSDIRACKKCVQGKLVQSIFEERSIYFCDKCGEKHCYNCYKLMHSSMMQCVSEEQLQLPKDCQRCRQCQTIVEKVTGCKHIKCICGFSFCFQCGYHWDQNHICQHKLPRRLGFSLICCCLTKSFFMVFILVFILLFLILGVFAVCFASSLLGGVTAWSALMTRYFSANKKSTIHDIQSSRRIVEAERSSEWCNCLVLVMGLLVLPLFMVVLGVIAFFVPFVNICYRQRLILDPDILMSILREMWRWIYLYMLI